MRLSFKIFWYFILSLLVLLITTHSFSQGFDDLNLSPKELRWLDEHPKLTVGVMEAWPPMDFVDFDGTPKGIGADFVQAINKRIGNRLKIVPGNWNTIYNSVKDKKMDALMGITPRKNREPFFNFTRPYAVVPHVIIARDEGHYYNSIEELEGKTIALEKGFFIVGYVKKTFPKCIVKEFKSTSDALDAVSKGQADAYIGNRAVANYLMVKELISNLVIQSKITATRSTNSIGVRKDYPELRSILDKVLASIPPEEITTIYRRWGSLSRNEKPSLSWIGLGPKEKQWLVSHPQIKVGVDSNRYPISFVDEKGEHKGIAIDYMKVISKTLGVKFQFEEDESWLNLVEKIKKRDVDIIPAMDITSKRKEFVSFSSAYLNVPLVIFTRDDIPYIGSLDELSGKKVAIVEGVSKEKEITKDYPKIQIVKTKNINDAISLLEANEVTAYIGTIMNTGHYIREAGYSNLKISGETSYRYRVAIAYRKDWQLFGQILQKALDSISASERNAIRKRWTSVTVESQIDYADLWKIVLGALALIFAIFIWNRRLAREIEQRIVAERELNKLSQAMEENSANVIITDVDGNIEYVNKHFLDSYNYTKEEVYGKNPRILRASDEGRDSFHDMWKVILAGGEWRADIENKTKHGDIRSESVVVSPIRDKKGKIINFVSIQTDITLRKRLEENLIKAKHAAEDATKAKSDFLANMSHEIRTPMNAIIGMSYLALKTKMTPQQLDYVTKIQSSAVNLLGIINDILDFSKIEAGKLELEIADFNLDKVMENMNSMIAPKASEKNIELVFDSDDDVPSFLKGDSLRLSQILLNLISNAIKFTDTEGEIVTKVVVVSRDDESVTLKFSVQDNGIGLSDEERSRLFVSFQQADTSTTRKYGGTGLGLTICKKLSEMMGGHIWVESQKGVGSVFSFTAKLGVREEVARSLDHKFEKMHVLVVDDCATARETLLHYLEGDSFIVHAVSSGEDAISEVKRRLQSEDNPFSLVLMDWQMPGIDGIEAMEEILSLYGNRDIDVIMITAYGREELVGQMESSGASAILLKPITKSQLFDTILSVVGKPYFDKSTEERESSSVSTLQLDGVKALLVEDNDINQQVAKEMMEREGASVTIATNGKHAVDTIMSGRDDEYDIVFMDLQMPIMDGFSACKIIRNESRFAELPIVAMTADAMSGVEEKVLDSGMNDYVTKPIDPPVLFEVTRKWVSVTPSERSEEITSSSNIEDGDLFGVSVADGLQRLGGNEELYDRLLRQFYNDYHDVQLKIDELIKSEDHEELMLLVHTIKGIALNLGVGKLGELASDLCDSIRQDKLANISSFKESFFDELEQVMDSLKDY